MRTQSPEVKEIALAAFPGYTGRHFQVQQFVGKMRLDSCWSEGSRDSYQFINLATKQTYTVPENGTPWSNGGKILECSELPMNVALVEYHQGRCDGITMFLREENMTKLLPAPGPELSRNEMIVLIATSSLKSSYGGVKNYRFTEAHERTRINNEEWEAAKASCISKGLLNAAGAITDDGRNACEGKRFDQYLPAFFYGMNKTSTSKTAIALNSMFSCWEEVQGAARVGIEMPDGNMVTGIGRCGSQEDFEARCLKNGYTILTTASAPQLETAQ